MGNEKVEDLLSSGQINVLKRASNGQNLIGTKSLDAKRSFVGDQVTLLWSSGCYLGY